ncbi:MAG: hypothetical protein WDW38_005068 [Sanguina aurantia]
MSTSEAEPCSKLDGAAPESTDFANYFVTYGYIYHQKDMLEDHKRTGAYYQAIMSNRRQFQGKVVLDVGTGSGILAIFAAKAGAKKVYAVEATSMALNARKLVEANKLDGVIEVIQGTIETITLPEKVDIIISEWMGYFLLRESMLDSVLVAYLVPTDQPQPPALKGDRARLLLPSHANMYLVPIRTNLNHQRSNDLKGWGSFIREMKEFYQVELDVLSEGYLSEQQDYFLHTAAWTDIHPGQLLGSPACFKRYDLHKLTLDELKAPLKETVQMFVSDGGPVEALCGYFDVLFKGSEENPADNEVRLTTAPDPTGATHWGQQSFYVQPPIECSADDKIRGTIEVVRQRANQRLLDVAMTLTVENASEVTSAPRKLHYRIE